MLAESIEENASMLELEFCYAMSFRKKSILFFLCLLYTSDAADD